MDFKEKYVELARKWLAKNPSNEPGDFNRVCKLRLQKELAGVDWTPADWLAAAEVVVHGPKSAQVELPVMPQVTPKPPMEDKAKLVNVGDGTEALPEVLLVGGRISRSGPVFYEKDDESTKREQGIRITEQRRRTTTRTIKDVEGYEAATKLIGSLNTGLGRICVTSLFGRLCPLSKEDELRAFIKEARIDAKKHNESPAGQLHKVRVRLVPGFIAGDAERVAKGLVTEMQDLFSEMQTALDTADVKAIRDVCDRMREAAPVFKGQEQDKINKAITAARKMARKLVSEVEKKGRLVEEVKMEISTESVSRARMDFLALPSDYDADLEEPAPELNEGQRYVGIDGASGEALDEIEEPAPSAYIEGV